MITWSTNVPVYLHRQPVDFRRQINGLSLIVQDAMQLDPYAEALFVFCNRSRNRIKVLYWQRNGFCLWLKRLEKHKFAWPTKLLTQDVITLEANELQWLLDGFDIWRQPPHQALNYTAVG